MNKKDFVRTVYIINVLPINIVFILELLKLLLGSIVALVWRDLEKQMVAQTSSNHVIRRGWAESQRSAAVHTC